MFRILATIILCLLALPAAADEVFPTYADYETFVDTKMKNREFSNVISRLGGADEYTPQQMEILQGQLRDLVPYYLTHADVAKRVELENGFAQEMRVYWNDKNSYVFVYTVLHEREDGLVVLSFSLNTNATPILEKF
ncbi:hypothetical protein [uncultured Ruegeria sp.]|uniref:hypothetical protein n=1 Tax=uncultured Ruegeria sp. TaxID=259304 RepID=UPI00262DF203|nr:hypothetical protein [uncultured Ruegeria sp.]